VAPEQPDAAIIISSLEDPRLFGAVFDRHFERIHRYLARRVGAALADDLAAETFVVAFRSRGRYDPVATDARPWLFGIAANLMRRHWRAERRQLRAYARTGVDPLADEFTDAERRADAAATGPRLAGALASLGRGEREALLLLAWAEFSYDEISAALRIPVGTVRSRLSRARERMRAALEPEPHGALGRIGATVPIEGEPNG
jgi:RNA polymerase sigma factor (sigma-70 family)